MDVKEQIVEKENKITEGIIWKQLLLFFFPILFGTFFQQLYNAVDAVIVGRFVGKEALSAVLFPSITVLKRVNWWVMRCIRRLPSAWREALS